ncbi:hypothetical protein [Gracilimonas sediminicola]|uniref:Uncharacterized protein n=1 Tax=Gracilimonas sediminicola TaxID=2952158 RepID=A0A9X2RAX9_9BACT|nr:hypothetical protein [Gracilimonas sediminicola]MCP9290050.1 hypothetical protein [Gracilimonas sediminicola]
MNPYKPKPNIPSGIPTVKKLATEWSYYNYVFLHQEQKDLLEAGTCPKPQKGVFLRLRKKYLPLYWSIIPDEQKRIAPKK